MVQSIQVQADTSQLSTVRQFVEDTASKVIRDPERVFDLKVAVSEACANAIEHACSVSEVIDVSAELNSSRLTFVVADQGCFRTPALPRSTHQSRGLGLPLMVSLMDDVHFCRIPHGGTTVSLSVLI